MGYRSIHAMPLVENLEKHGVHHCTTTIWTKQQRAGRVHGAGDRRASHTTPANNGRSAVIGDREREREELAIGLIDTSPRRHSS